MNSKSAMSLCAKNITKMVALTKMLGNCLFGRLNIDRVSIV